MSNKQFIYQLITAILLVNTSFCLASQNKQPLTLNSIFASDLFKNASLDNIQWKDNGTSFTFTRQSPKTEQSNIYKYLIATNTTRLIIAANSITHKSKPIALHDYQWTEDQRFLLLAGTKVLTWDNVVEAPYFIYEMATKKLTPLANGRALRNVNVSPDGQWVGYVRENNIYITDLNSQQTLAVTTDGSTNIFNGIFDYGSTEFDSLDAWHWSPDGKNIAFWRLDATDVKPYYIIDELGKYNQVHTLKYPNTAERHAVNKIGVYNISKGLYTTICRCLNRTE